MKLSSADRKALVKLASGLPKGSEERRAILAGLGKAGPGGHPASSRANGIWDRVEKMSGGDLSKARRVIEKALGSTYQGYGSINKDDANSVVEAILSFDSEY